MNAYHILGPMLLQLSPLQPLMAAFVTLGSDLPPAYPALFIQHLPSFLCRIKLDIVHLPRFSCIRENWNCDKWKHRQENRKSNGSIIGTVIKCIYYLALLFIWSSYIHLPKSHICGRWKNIIFLCTFSAHWIGDFIKILQRVNIRKGIN